MMTLDAFLEHVGSRGLLDRPEIYEFMNIMSEEARRITFELNSAYHTPEEVRNCLSRLFGKKVDPTLRVFPPFYTDFGKNITVGKNVWVGSNSTILQGVHIGDNAIIAAGSVVTKDVPENTIAGGVPARHIRNIPVSE